VDEAVEAARSLVLDVSQGLSYYDTYDRAFLQVPQPPSLGYEPVYTQARSGKRSRGGHHTTENGPFIKGQFA
jgi:hypothetical protein